MEAIENQYNQAISEIQSLVIPDNKREKILYKLSHARDCLLSKQKDNAIMFLSGAMREFPKGKTPGTLILLFDSILNLKEKKQMSLF